MQCGLCAVVAGLFRRAMCIASGSRRGSGESCYQELASEVRKTSVTCVKVEEALPASRIITSSSFHEKTQHFKGIERGEKRSSEIIADNSEQNEELLLSSEEAKLGESGNLPVSESPKAASEQECPIVIDERLPIENRRLSDGNRALIDNLDVSEIRPKHTGRFLTMHKRRRKRLVTRSLNQESGMLDDVFHGQVQCVLERAGNWKFNAFTLETVTGGRSLPVLCVHLFHWYGLLDHFNLDVVRVWKLFTLIEEGYHSTNPYHNSIHATDVTQAMHCFLQEKKIRENLSNLEIMASLIAAVTHDLDHPGVNQPFLVATSNHLAALYENTSVLENHHWRSAIGCLLESGVSEQLPDHLKPELQHYISSLILATDITRQQEFLTKFKRHLDLNELDMKKAEYRHFILQIALKCADISNPCRPWEISRKWAYKVCEEFFRQGDYERQLNLPVTPICDRTSTSIPKIQTGFFNFVVLPLYEEWHRFLSDTFSNELMNYLHNNERRWEQMIQNEEVNKIRCTEHTEFDVDIRDDRSLRKVPSPCQEEDEDSTPEKMEWVPPPRRSSLPGGHGPPDPSGRRHSVPLSIVKGLNTNSKHSKHSNQLRLEDATLLESSSLSLISSRSSAAESGACSTSERPVSAENLLPDTSIASITSSNEASKICTILQPPELLSQRLTQAQRYLLRQQTFPPVQQYARARYLSTTAEMTNCCEVVLEADHSTSSSPSPATSPARSSNLSPSLMTKRPSAPSLGVPTTSERRRASAQETSHSSVKSDQGPRRHSLQVVQHQYHQRRQYHHQHNRSSSQSAQGSETDNVVSPLTGSMHVQFSENTGDISEISNSSRSDLCSTPPYAKILLNREIEPRRHSSPVPDSRNVKPDVSSGRRFTTIPVTSEGSPRGKVFFIGSPPDSPPRVQSATSSSDSGSEPRKSIGGSSNDNVSVGSKRDSDITRDKGSKILKLSFETQMKENVDPRAVEDFTKGALPPRRSNMGWARRRGSAPVGLLSSKLDDIAATSISNKINDFTRRGSVPTDITSHQNGSVNKVSRGDKTSTIRRSSLPHETAISNLLSNTDNRENYPLNINNNNNNINNFISNNNGSSRLMEGLSSPRRGSVPADISELRRDLLVRTNSNAGKTTRGRKKMLRRRSSGGPEMFHGCGVADGDNNGSSWQRAKRETIIKRDSLPEPVVTKRRGSLPIDMLNVSSTGRYIHR